MRRKSDLSLDLFGDRLSIPVHGKEPVDLEYRRMLRSLQAAMEGELTARQKECIRLRYFEQMRVNEIAETLGLRRGQFPYISKRGGNVWDGYCVIPLAAFPGVRQNPQRMKACLCCKKKRYFLWRCKEVWSISLVSPGFRQRIFARIRGCFKRLRTILLSVCPL